ncbi:hypothetical protein XENOCAPTIV_030756 [Xenoophorus captivus]|uniref:Uncharacterized protein n=1 Tax=Xenoophorus captivus TaxID=1517983 RepID=A0ABV0QDE0_9TELE
MLSQSEVIDMRRRTAASSPCAALHGNERRRLRGIREGTAAPRVLLAADPSQFCSLSHPSREYVKIMLAVWCFMVFGAVGERLAVSGADGGLWDWFAPSDQLDNGETEITYPKRLVQQIRSEEEMAHGYLDTRVKNSTGDSSVSHLSGPYFCLSSPLFTL